MQTDNDRNWLLVKIYQSGTISVQMHRAGRVEVHYGDPGALYSGEQLEALISELIYTTQDRSNNKPNETRIPFEGNAYNNLVSYRDALRHYQRFLEDETDIPTTELAEVENVVEVEPLQTIGLEKEMQPQSATT